MLVEGTIDKEFDYVVPESMIHDARLGSLVRVDLGGRRVGGWIVATDAVAEPDVDLKPIAKITGLGPTAEIIGLARWAAHRWAGRLANLLTTASPPKAVTGLPVPAITVPAGGVNDAVVADAFGDWPTVLRLAPTEDLYPVALAAAQRGNALIVAPSVEVARGLAARLRRTGVDVALHPDQWAKAHVGATVIGARAAAWAPMAEPAAFVVLDEHDEVHQEERVPTWHARDVMIERARRAGVPCVLTSPMPTLEARAVARVVSRPVSLERNGWSIIDVVDRRNEDPRRAGLFSPKLVRQLRSDARVLCVLNRTGRARLIACDSCGVVATCESCDAAVIQPESDYVCLRCDTARPAICQACGSTASRNIRAGVSRVREELVALVREDVDEVTGSSKGEARSRVVVGTEALLHQVRAADSVAFLDFDQELLAPRYRAAEQALSLIVRACRIVGGRHQGGRVLLQTRQPDHEVIKAAVNGEPDRLVKPELDRREILGFPPALAVADVSGPAAPQFIEALGQPMGVEVMGPRDGHWLVKAPDHEMLADALAATHRPGGRLRIAVDPLRV